MLCRQANVVALTIPWQFAVLSNVGTAGEHAQGIPNRASVDAQRLGAVAVDIKAQHRAIQLQIHTDVTHARKTRQLLKYQLGLPGQLIQIWPGHIDLQGCVAHTRNERKIGHVRLQAGHLDQLVTHLIHKGSLGNFARRFWL